MNKIGENIKEIREQRQVSEYDIERNIGIPHQVQYRWEKGENLPNIEQLIKLADYYCISIDELVGHEIKKSW